MSDNLDMQQIADFKGLEYRYDVINVTDTVVSYRTYYNIVERLESPCPLHKISC